MIDGRDNTLKTGDRMNTRRIEKLLALATLAALAAGCGEEPVEETPVVRPVKIVTIGGPGSGAIRELPGTIRAVQNADMAFEVPGRITDFLVTEGQDVTRGTELARLDPRDYDASFDQANAAYRKAQADLARSERIYKQDSGAISTSKIETDRKAVEVAEAALRQARKAVEDTVLRAPFDGLVARRLVEDFQNVQAKEPVLILQDLSSLEIEVSVPERDVARSGQRPDLERVTQQAQLRVQVSSLPGSNFPAVLTEFATTADPATRSFQARLKFEPPDDSTVLPGMTARVIYNAILDDVIRLPSHAAFSDDLGNALVWIVVPDSMRVARRPVTLGGLTGSDVEVVSGLAFGDQVAISGVSQLREGMQVRRLEN